MKQKQTGHGGFTAPLNIALRNGTKYSNELRSEHVFDCRISDQLYLRQSHDNNSPVKIGYKNSIGNEYDRCGFVSCPSRFNVDFRNMTDIEIENKFRDQCEKILKHYNETNPKKKPDRETVYDSWDDNLHSLTTNNPRSLDEIFTDQSVLTIVSMYLVTTLPSKCAYNMFKKEGISASIFSRNKNTGMYSKTAIEELGYPNNIVAPGEVSELENETSDDSDVDDLVSSSSSSSSSSDDSSSSSSNN
jgi:hypothetical protein